MPQLPNSPIRVQFGLRGWAAIATAVIVFGAVTLLAVSFLVLLLPILILAPVLYWFMPKPTFFRVRNKPEREAVGDKTVIDGEFRVIDAGMSEEKSEPSSTHKP